MKAIAEYFRDLAADDRYFGAEPPTPDAAMLHQIAEREMKRRVETKIQDNGVILRARDSDDVYDGASIASQKGVPPPKTDVLFEDQHATPARAATPTAPQPTAQARSTTDSVISDSVAAKLSRIRNAMAETRASGETTRPASNFVAERAIAEGEAAEEAEAKAKVEAAKKEESAAQAKAEAVAAEKAKAEAQAKADAEAAETAKAEAQAKADAEAAEKAKAEAQAKADAEAAEKAKAEAQAKADAEAAEKAKAEATNDSDSTAADDAILASLAGAFDDEDGATDGRFDDEAFDAILEPLDAEGEDTLMASLAAAMSETIEAPVKAPKTAAQEEADDAILEALDTDVDETATAPAQEAKPAPKDPVATEGTSDVTPTLQRARARVIKIRRSPEPPVETPVPPPAANPAPAAQTPTAGMLSPEAEADLMRELAELEYDQPQVEKTQPAAPQPATHQNNADSVAPVRPQRPVSSRRQSGKMSASEDDASVKRLLDQTNTELEGEENRRRLSAIAHLKAAVAATVADRKEGGDQGPTEEMRMNPYRNDLERAVRARPNATASGASSAERAAPLMLVSEQRIDEPRLKQTAQGHVTPVRPRRVPTGNLAVSSRDDEDLDATANVADGDNIFDRTTSFSDYAEKLGAGSLAELLEAAVAYSTHIHGNNEVTRPQMLHHVLSAQPELEGDRETMLRSFGTLLREGRIEKVRRGHFILSETSSIHAEALRVAKR
ncbi:hypothetical protein ACEN2J_01875 [Pseudorhodobacter sp. W20_MBD10_FR17]|uniref:hypothetical protein n=1 Tax=Pseudorhodobacter sp. W20_MBD10_FR17 TaxID=3240266 RepID=UPI003F950D44